LDEVSVGIVDPAEVVALDFEREELVLVHAAVLDLVHSVELALEEHEVAGLGGVLVENVLLELVKSVNDLKEVALGKEELEVL
jgi:hypothetical protein